MSAAVEAIRAGGGTRITGPAALTGDWRRAAHLTWTLAVLEFRLKFFGSVLGYVWQLMRPLLMFGVYYVVFTQVVQVGTDVKYYPPLLLAGIMLYQFFAEVTSGSVGAVVGRENLVRKIHFPRIVIPLAVVLQAIFNLGVNMIAVGAFMAIQGVPLRLNWLAVVPATGMLLVFVTGLAMLLSALFVRYRDVQPIWEVIVQAAFYATPILYPIEKLSDSGNIPEWGAKLVMCNPLAVVVQQVRHSVFDPSAPSPADVLGGVAMLAIPIAITLATFALGFYVFNGSAPEVAENL
jgi:ABC-2 type transport system permease protein